MDLLGIFMLALAGGFLIGRAVSRRAWLEGLAEGRKATSNQTRWQHEDPSQSEGA